MVVEAGGKALPLDGRIVARAPALEGFGIMEAEALAVAPFEAAVAGERLEAGLADQHSAGEDVGLDEVGIGRIGFEQGLADRDELKRRAASRPEQAGDRLDIRLPIIL